MLHALPPNSSWFDHPRKNGEEYKLWSSSLCSFLQSPREESVPQNTSPSECRDQFEESFVYVCVYSLLILSRTPPLERNYTYPLIYELPIYEFSLQRTM
jgi:hypothetical protein